MLASEQIANALSKRKGKVTVFVPHYAMSGGTMIALSADEVVMDGNAVLGPVDPQVGNFPAVSILKVLADKPAKDIDDETMIMADMSRKAHHAGQSYHQEDRLLPLFAGRGGKTGRYAGQRAVDARLPDQL